MISQFIDFDIRQTRREKLAVETATIIKWAFLVVWYGKISSGAINKAPDTSARVARARKSTV